ncbi:hypothetical protein ACO0SA_001996 [Hanseniaspora valbyensis]
MNSQSQNVTISKSSSQSISDTRKSSHDAFNNDAELVINPKSSKQVSTDISVASADDPIDQPQYLSFDIHKKAFDNLSSTSDSETFINSSQTKFTNSTESFIVRDNFEMTPIMGQKIIFNKSQIGSEKKLLKNSLILLQSTIDQICRFNPVVTMTQTRVDKTISSEEKKEYIENRLLGYSLTDMAFSETNDTDLISDQITNYCTNLIDFDIRQIIHNATLDHINTYKSNMIIKSDMMVFTNKLIKSVTDDTQFGDNIIQHSNLRHRLLIFFDTLYPVYDFIHWVEQNYRHNSLNFKHILTYYIFKILTINLQNLDLQVPILQTVITTCEEKMDKYAKKQTISLLEKLYIIDKIHVLAINSESLPYLFKDDHLTKQTLPGSKLIRTAKYNVLGSDRIELSNFSNILNCSNFPDKWNTSKTFTKGSPATFERKKFPKSKNSKNFRNHKIIYNIGINKKTQKSTFTNQI